MDVFPTKDGQAVRDLSTADFELLEDGVLRHVSEAFAEDPVRILRVARFAARYGFRIAEETLDYLIREMRHPAGGFFSATDADSEGEEGKFFVWTPEQIRAAVPTEDDTRLLCAYYDVTAGGNWEHTNVLWTPRERAGSASSIGRPGEITLAE